MSGEAVPVLIIGGGPAGMAAAIELIRQGHKPVIVEKRWLGGMLCNANLVENYPGFPGGIKGIDLVERFTEQIHKHGTEIICDEVVSLDYDNGVFRAKRKSDELLSRAVIIATGTKPRTIDGLAEQNLAGDKVFHEIYPIRQVKEKKVAIIGAGDVAFDFALSLAGQNEVVVLNRNVGPKCCPGLWRMVQQTNAITCKTNTSVTPPVREDRQGVILDCRNATGRIELYADYLVVAIGREANVDCLSKMTVKTRVSLETAGLLQLAGDVGNPNHRQTAIAVGGGTLAAMKVARALEGIT